MAIAGVGQREIPLGKRERAESSPLADGAERIEVVIQPVLAAKEECSPATRRRHVFHFNPPARALPFAFGAAHADDPLPPPPPGIIYLPAYLPPFVIPTAPDDDLEPSLTNAGARASAAAPSGANNAMISPPASTGTSSAAAMAISPAIPSPQGRVIPFLPPFASPPPLRVSPQFAAAVKPVALSIEKTEEAEAEEDTLVDLTALAGEETEEAEEEPEEPEPEAAEPPEVFKREKSAVNLGVVAGETEGTEEGSSVDLTAFVRGEPEATEEEKAAEEEGTVDLTAFVADELGAVEEGLANKTAMDTPVKELSAADPTVIVEKPEAAMETSLILGSNYARGAAAAAAAAGPSSAAETRADRQTSALAATQFAQPPAAAAAGPSSAAETRADRQTSALAATQFAQPPAAAAAGPSSAAETRAAMRSSAAYAEPSTEGAAAAGAESPSDPFPKFQGLLPRLKGATINGHKIEDLIAYIPEGRSIIAGTDPLNFYQVIKSREQQIYSFRFRKGEFDQVQARVNERFKGLLPFYPDNLGIPDEVSHVSIPICRPMVFEEHPTWSPLPVVLEKAPPKTYFRLGADDSYIIYKDERGTLFHHTYLFAEENFFIAESTRFIRQYLRDYTPLFGAQMPTFIPKKWGFFSYQ